jgi:hypothetical protein
MGMAISVPRLTVADLEQFERREPLRAAGWPAAGDATGEAGPPADRRAAACRADVIRWPVPTTDLVVTFQLAELFAGVA